MKTLIVYFSYTAGGDIVSLEPVKAYEGSYNDVVSQGQEEVERNYKPALKSLGVNIHDYERIVVGSPTWWYKMAPAVLAFLSENDFTGKTVIPFMTNAGWPGTVLKDMTAVAMKNGAKVEDGHEFRFCSDSKHFDRMMTSKSELEKWISTLK